jgi:hypothetical protein
VFSAQNEEALDSFEKEWAGYALGALLRDAGRTEEEGVATLECENAKQPN